MPKNLDGMKKKFSIIPNYLKLEKGEERNFVFMGIKSIEMNDKQTKAKEEKRAVYLARPEGLYFAVNTQLVNAFESANIAPQTPVSITFTGLDGDVKIFEVYVLE